MRASGLWLVPRPAEEAARIREAFAAHGATALVFAVLEIVPRDAGAIDPAPLQAVLLTSRNGARALARLDLPRTLRVLAIGDATAAVAREAGFAAVASAAGDAGALAALAQATLSPERGALLHLSGAALGQDPAPALRAAGFAVERRIAYAAEPVAALPPEAADALAAAPPPAGVAFFSPRTVEVFDTVLRQAGLADRRSRLVALCLSRAVAERLDGGAWAAVRIAARPALDALLEIAAPVDVRAGATQER
jgi:uroporphyrinogen-III synthase